ncbi:hypothetical protein [Phytomonospora endophytica]|uniref:Uncharacterized protein n=1 Tax=Phytomonospora endophytica TaxID=714109 RepID=A0A841FFN6_9ACTN|nr:hypothetical protein [Phytomonospora endophytica]MBB6034664.1 hypothetical protein [Phytomonospora endophytica]GIG69135.1 hypothetical protein Pen01_54300 [Phytomonospora endophytica]
MPRGARDVEWLYEPLFFAGHLVVMPALVHRRAWRRTGSLVRAVPSVLAESTRFG